MATNLDALRRNSHRIIRLPDQAQRVVDDYLHIKVGGAEVACPYHINPGLRSGNRALLGKGRPQEIEETAAAYFKKYAMQVDGDPVTLRAFLLACGIGVDCSGFAAWVLNGVTEANLNGPIWKCLAFPGWRRRLVARLRPIENISANLLTGHLNSRPISDFSQVKPGDLLRVAGGHHVVVITEVGLNKAGEAVYFAYAQSSCMYGAAGGVRIGHAVITEPQGLLLQQAWCDNFDRNVIEELIAEGGTDSRIVRLKVFS